MIGEEEKEAASQIAASVKVHREMKACVQQASSSLLIGIPVYRMVSPKFKISHVAYFRKSLKGISPWWV